MRFLRVDFNHKPERLGLSHQLDLRLDKEFYFKKWMLDLYMDVQNVYGFQNESKPNYTNLDVNGTALKPIGLSSYDGSDGNLNPDLSTLTTALKIARSITLEVR